MFLGGLRLPLCDAYLVCLIPVLLACGEHTGIAFALPCLGQTTRSRFRIPMNKYEPNPFLRCCVPHRRQERFRSRAGGISRTFPPLGPSTSPVDRPYARATREKRHDFDGNSVNALGGAASPRKLRREFEWQVNPDQSSIVHGVPWETHGAHGHSHGKW